MAIHDIHPEETRRSPFDDLQTVRVRVSQAQNIGETMENIRIWLDQHKVHPASFRTTADARGYLLTIDFPSKEAAKRFRRQFGEGLITPQSVKASPEV